MDAWQRKYIAGIPLEPWDLRKRLIPLKTYSGSIKYAKKPKVLSPKDVARITKNMMRPENADQDWEHVAVKILYEANLFMLQKILFFVDEITVAHIYDWILGLIDWILGYGTQQQTKSRAIRLIQHLAYKAGISITIGS